MNNILDKLIEDTSTQLSLDVSLVEKVINFKWKSVHKALSLYKTIEDSGLGDWSIRPKRVVNYSKKLAEIESAYRNQLQDGRILSDRKKESINRKIESLVEDQKYLQSKIQDEVKL